MDRGRSAASCQSGATEVIKGDEPGWIEGASAGFERVHVGKRKLAGECGLSFFIHFT
jgi:hypothetical protein